LRDMERRGGQGKPSSEDGSLRLENRPEKVEEAGCKVNSACRGITGQFPTEKEKNPRYGGTAREGQLAEGE